MPGRAKAPAPAPPLDRWDYLWVPQAPGPGDRGPLSALGAEGWEVVCLRQTGGTDEVLMKRKRT